MESSIRKLFIGKLIGNTISVCLAIFIGLTGMGCQETPISFADKMTNLVPSEGNLSPEFSTLVLNYRLEVGSDTESITLTPTLEGENITVSINGVDLNSGVASQAIPLTGEQTDIQVNVVSESINLNYMVSVFKSASFNAFLSDLQLSNGQYTPELEASSVSPEGYFVTLPSLTSSIKITATLDDSRSSLSINGTDAQSGVESSAITLNEGNNQIEIVVTAQNQTTQQTYRLNVNRSSPEEFALYTYLKATNTGAEDTFGDSVAIWNNQLVIGAIGESSNATEVNGDQNDNSLPQTGAAYLYEKNESNEWQFKAYLKPAPDDELSLRYFARAVAISNDYIAVSARNSAYQGQVHLFKKDDSDNWAQTEIIKFDGSVYGVGFGRTLLLRNNLLIVGHPGDRNFATGEDDPNAQTYRNSGAVFIYQLDQNETGNNSQNYTYIRRGDSRREAFGSSIALSGNTLAIGSPVYPPSSTGAVTIYTFNSESGWTQQAFLQASSPQGASQFGASVSLSGNRLVVGAPLYEAPAEPGRFGGVYIFEQNDGISWQQKALLSPTPRVNSILTEIFFGGNVFITGDTLVVAASGEFSSSANINGVEDTNLVSLRSGAAFIFEKDNASIWNQTYYIKASNADANDGFAHKISSYGNEIIFSAPREDSIAKFGEGNQSDNSAVAAGAAYLYHNAPFNNHNLALTVVSSSNSVDGIQGINLDTSLVLSDCLSDCSQLVDRGQNIQLTPVPGNGASQFDHWEGDLVCRQATDEYGVITVPILAETYCKAIFSDKAINLSLTKATASNATGTLQATEFGTVIATCDETCDSVTSGLLDLNTPIRITARAENGAFVAAWSGDADCQNNAINLNTVTTLSMDSSKNCTALFSFPETQNLQRVVDTNGLAVGSIAATNISTGIDLENCDSNCSDAITKDHSVQLTAVVGNSSSEFTEWLGDEECAANANGTNITTVLLSKDVQCNAVFAEIVIQEFVLTVSKDSDSTASGTIQGTYNNDLVVTCDASCTSADSSLLLDGSTVLLTAAPENGAQVSSWSGDPACQANATSDNTSTSIQLNASKTCTAKFDSVAPSTNDLRVVVANNPNSLGQVQATNNDTGEIYNACLTDCTEQIITGQTVQLVATALNSSSEFTGWSGDAACTANINPSDTATVIVNADTNCTANFDVVSQSTNLIRYIVANSLNSSGSIRATNLNTGDVSSACFSDCTDQVTTGDSVSLFASPLDASSQFVGWSGDPACTANINPADTATVVVNSDVTCTADFTIPSGDITITLAKDADQTGDGSISAVMFDFELIGCPSGCTSATSAGVDANSFILLFASPDNNSQFIEWGGDPECSANANGTDTNVTLSVAKTCTAKFDLLPPASSN